MSVRQHPILSLKTALRARLAANPDVTALVGAAIHDAPPRGLEPPYLAFADASARENGTSDAGGAIIDCEVTALTRERGSAAALAVIAAVEAAFADPLPALAEHRLVALDLIETRTRHDPAASLTRATLRLRAYTEPL